MPKSQPPRRQHPRPWRNDSIFGLGRRVPLCREKRAVYKARLNLHCRGRRITDKFEKIGLALLRRLGADGRCDPTYKTIAADAGCEPSTVRNALPVLRACGLLLWERRLVRNGWGAAQTSNAYVLTLGDPPEIPRKPCEGKVCRGIPKGRDSILLQPAGEGAEWVRWEDQTALARAAARRQAAIDAANQARRAARWAWMA